MRSRAYRGRKGLLPLPRLPQSRRQQLLQMQPQQQPQQQLQKHMAKPQNGSRLLTPVQQPHAALLRPRPRHAGAAAPRMALTA